jgi:2-polyprenyl-6-methoxyphenol hydroxylase-like FAD-dependent oxidoreductase
LRGIPYLTLRRTALVSALREAIGSVASIRLGTTVIDMQSTGRAGVAVLSDGTKVEYDLLIAADGFRSQLRDRLFGPDCCNVLPLGYRFAVYDFASSFMLGSDFLSFMEPGHLVEYYALDR